jgi:hypothetical protein
VLLALRTCIDEPGTRGVVLSPTYRTLKDVFIQTWCDTVPPELYSIKWGDMTIELVNGSKILLRSRHVDNPNRGKDANRGLDVNWVIDDEAARGYDAEQYSNMLACIRRPGNLRFYACTTTPLLNEYHDLATSDGHTVVYSSSRDNPHLPEGWVDDLASQMSPQQAEREIDGRWVALEGLVWGTWDDSIWPEGNIHEHTFSAKLPWYLFLDLGVGNGAYVAAQRVDATHRGRRLFDGGVWVVVAELTPLHDGSASRAFQRLLDNFGRPSKVVAGSDINTRASTDGKTAMYFVRQAFGGAVPVVPVQGWIADKQIQYNRLLYMMAAATGERRLCVSKNLISLDGDAGRGVMQLVKQDTWPERAGKARGVFLEKDGRLEHIRDALLYGAVHVSPPRMTKSGHPA